MQPITSPVSVLALAKPGYTYTMHYGYFIDSMINILQNFLMGYVTTYTFLVVQARCVMIRSSVGVGVQTNLDSWRAPGFDGKFRELKTRQRKGRFY